MSPSKRLAIWAAIKERESRLADRTGKRQSRRCCAHQAVALRVEGHERDRRPIAGRSAPAPGIALACVLIQRVARGEQGPILAEMALGRGDVADAAMPMLVIVPAHEAHRPLSRCLEV